MDKDEEFMGLALAEARKAMARGEVPVGAVIVMDGKVVARGHNSPISLNDPCGHAEVLAIRKAAKKIGNYRLTGAEMYVTLEPCVMCAGAIVNARISRVVFGAADPKGGAVVSLFEILGDGRLNHFAKAQQGVLQEPCAEILSRFFRGKRITSSARKKTRCGEIPKWS